MEYRSIGVLGIVGAKHSRDFKTPFLQPITGNASSLQKPNPLLQIFNLTLLQHSSTPLLQLFSIPSHQFNNSSIH